MISTLRTNDPLSKIWPEAASLQNKKTIQSLFSGLGEPSVLRGWVSICGVSTVFYRLSAKTVSWHNVTMSVGNRYTEQACTRNRSAPLGKQVMRREGSHVFEEELDSPPPTTATPMFRKERPTPYSLGCSSLETLYVWSDHRTYKSVFRFKALLPSNARGGCAPQGIVCVERLKTHTHHHCHTPPEHGRGGQEVKKPSKKPLRRHHRHEFRLGLPLSWASVTEWESYAVRNAVSGICFSLRAPRRAARMVSRGRLVHNVKRTGDS